MMGSASDDNFFHPSSTTKEIIEAINNAKLLRSEINGVLIKSKTEDDDRRSDSNTEMDKVMKEVWHRFRWKHNISPFSVNNNRRINKISGNGDGHLRNIKEDRIGDVKGVEKMREGSFLSSLTFQGLRGLLRIFGVIFSLLMFLVVIYCFLTLHRPTQAFISRHTQDLIYPLLRGLRLMSIPVVRRFPILTVLYEESCLISNPFYEIGGLECWPCENVRHVIDLTGFTNFSSAYHNSGTPFIVKDANPKEELTLGGLRSLVLENEGILGDLYVKSRKDGVRRVGEFMRRKDLVEEEEEDLQWEWYINRASLVRFWRKHFPKPYFIPNTTEVSVQHFLFVSGKSVKPYPLPITEFANVFIIQSSGTRSIILIPTKQCQNSCKVVSALLRPKDVLFYNWMFWRPMSIPTTEIGSLPSSATSIQFIGSFY